MAKKKQQEVLLPCFAKLSARRVHGDTVSQSATVGICPLCCRQVLLYYNADFQYSSKIKFLYEKTKKNKKTPDVPFFQSLIFILNK